MKKDRLEALYRYYRSGFDTVPAPEESQILAPGTAADATGVTIPPTHEVEYHLLIPVQTPQIDPRRIIGSIRVLEQKGGDVAYLILEQKEERYYLCIKTSQFKEFFLPGDMIEKGRIDEWLIEVGNRFFLSEDEIGHSPVLDEVEIDVLLAISLRMAKNEKSGEPPAAEGGEVPSRWHLEFQCHEYEMTVELRSRSIDDHPPILQLPEILWHKEREDKNGNVSYKFSAVPATLEEVYSLTSCARRISIDRERDYRIESGDGGGLYLIPASKYTGLDVTILCRDICIYKGRIDGALKLCGTLRRIAKEAIAGLQFIIKDL